MVFPEEKSREWIQKLIENVRTQEENSSIKRKKPGKLDIIRGVQTAIRHWNGGVWTAVENNVAFRLPHELEDKEGIYANCGEGTFVLYAAAKELRLRNPRFILYKANSHLKTNHGCVLFDLNGRTYIADPFHGFTCNFELRPRRIRIDGSSLEHSGIKYLSNSELERFISGLRGGNTTEKLFKSGQLLVTQKTSNGSYEIFIVFNKKRRSIYLPNSTGPTLDVLLSHDEPYNENTGVALVYPLTEDKPFNIHFFDSWNSGWGDLSGVKIGYISAFGTSNECYVQSQSEKIIMREELLEIIAYLDYRKEVERTARERGKDPDKVYLLPNDKRDIIARLHMEMDILSLQKSRQKRKIERLFGEIQSWTEDVFNIGHDYYQRYCDFHESTLWSYEKKRNKVIREYKRRHSSFSSLMAEYVEEKHMGRMRQLLDEHGDKINTVREKLLAESNL